MPSQLETIAHIKATMAAPNDPMTLVRRASSKDLLHGLPRSKTCRDIQAAERIPQAIYLGLEVEVHQPDECVRYGVCTHDGSWTLDFYEETLKVGHLKTLEEKLKYFEDEIIENIRTYMHSQNYKVHLIGLGLRVCDTTCVDYGVERMAVYGKDIPSLASRIWLELDALPYIVHAHGSQLDERANMAARKAVVGLSPQTPGNIPRVQVGYRNRVMVDGDGEIHMVDLAQYKATCKEETWVVMHKLAQQVRDKNLRISFFNSTPQGGGVAIMRHALIRLCRLLKVDVQWYVTRPSPEVFNVTKRKFHNVLQGVAPPECRLTEDDKVKWLSWTKANLQTHWGGQDGPIMTSDIIVIDDPQVSGLIPWIRKLNPKCRIIYRSHIEIRADLIRDDPKGPQAETWDFLWSAIKQADLFISHPVSNFIPDTVPMNHVVLMPATTDPLDGLNKDITEWSTSYYRQVFNRVCYDQGARSVDWERPYIVQVARFDPSKGIPDVLHAFLLLHQKLEATDGNMPVQQLPQLVICGHGSVDDPDGTWVYEQAHEILSGEDYKEVQGHVIVARIPPCDQLLNTAMSGATVALQLSHKEGFEVKVTEAICKGIPMVAYKAGGIPFQIEDGKNGFLVEVGDTTAVADRLYRIFTEKGLRESLSEYGKKNVTDEYFTAHNFTNWAYLWNKILEKPRAEERHDDVHLEERTDHGSKQHQVNGVQKEEGMSIDGDTTCVPSKLMTSKAPNDVLGGAKWVRELWRKEYVENGAPLSACEPSLQGKQGLGDRRGDLKDEEALAALTHGVTIPHDDQGPKPEGGSDFLE